MRILAPSHSAVSPASRAFKQRTYSATCRHGMGRLPSENRPVKPDPIATATRSGAWSASSAMAAALTMGCRRLGTSTPGPRPMRDVRSAHRVRIIHTSGYRAGES